MTLQEQKRISWLDIARGIAVLWVVFGHTLRGGAVQRIVYSFHVAAFFFLSGMTCKAKPFRQQLRKDLLRIMVPYYAFGILSILVYLLLGRFAAGHLSLDADTSLWTNLKDLLYACPKGNRMKFNMPLWFLPCLFATKLLYYALHSLCKEKPPVILAASLACAALGFVFTGLGYQRLPFHLSVSLKMLFFFALGRFSFLPATRWAPGKYKALLLGLLLLAITAAAAWFAPKVNYSGDDFPSIPAFLLTSLTGTLGLCLLSVGIGQCRPLEQIGSASLAVLTMHKFPILLFQTVGPLKDPLMQYDTAVGLVSATAVSVIAVALCLLARRIILRYVPFLLGH